MDEWFSPYASSDSFAGNPLLIDLELLDTHGVLTEADWERVAPGQTAEKWREGKEALLYQLFLHWAGQKESARLLEAYYEKEKWWLKSHLWYWHHREKTGTAWREWEKGFEKAGKVDFSGKGKLGEHPLAYRAFLQWAFQEQYTSLKEYANGKGISLFGDLPFYVNHESVDVWANQSCFLLDEEGLPLYQAAVPPDQFSPQGQLWGNPVYDWTAMREDGFSYWKKRIRRMEDLFDYLRIDHFRGLEAYYRVPAGRQDATEGEWVKVPGDQLLETLERTSSLPLIGENLGHITPEVAYLLEKHHLPGMLIFQFTKDFYGFAHKKDTVYYTGTHDNQTVRQWLQETYPIRKDAEEAHCWDAVRKVYRSRAHWAIVPLQDLLCLGEEGRMNRPGTTGGNWLWVAGKDWKALALPLREMTREFDRS